MLPTRPRPLAAGAHVQLFAASSPFDLTRFEAGRALLAARYLVRAGEAVLARRGFLAGSDEARLADLSAGLEAPETSALIAVRGGYGATRLLPALDPGRIQRAAKWLVGFSDVTALHALWAHAGMCSVHGPMVCSLPEAPSAVQDAWFRLLEGAPPEPLTGLTALRGGSARGRLFAGNLAVLCALVGTPYFPPLDDAVLVLEDVGERPYRIDRMLTTMLQAGCLSGVRGFVLGHFTECPPGADGVSAAEVLEERLGTLGVPVLSGAPIGHVADNRPLLLGAIATVDAEAGRVDFEVD